MLPSRQKYHTQNSTATKTKPRLSRPVRVLRDIREQLATLSDSFLELSDLVKVGSDAERLRRMASAVGAAEVSLAAVSRHLGRRVGQ